MVLNIENLSKQYGPLQAVSSLSLSIDKGSVYGILGPNGSGKTTTLGMVLGVTNATSGRFSWFDNSNGYHDRKRIGAILETPNFYHYLSAYANLKIAAEIKGVDYSDIDRVLEVVNLSSRKNSRFSTFSLGMKQRLAIASSMLGNPEVLVLDEPTNGLDPAGIAEIRELITNIAKEGRTIILASHLLDEVEKVCTHVAVLQKGKLLASGSVSEVLASEDIIEVGADNLEKLEAAARANSNIKSLRKNSSGRLEISTHNHSGTAELNEYLYKQGIVVSHLALRKKSLEARFLELTKS
jgi:ABC-type multidrug transport system ATPase subunit